MERLQKVIANSGYASRRKAEELIAAGKVKVNGKVVKELGTKVGRNDEILVEGNQIAVERKVYIMLNKPAGYITTVSDDKGRRTVMDLVTDIPERIYPVGRLDYDTNGVLLMTNDGDFTNKLIHPSSYCEKEYLARVEGIPARFLLDKLEEGIELDGFKTKPSYVKVESVDKKNNSSLVKIILTEGKYHQVKNMFKAIGHPVKKLTRVRFGCIAIEGLPKGAYRVLKPHEIKTLIELSNKKPIPREKLDIRKMRRI